MNTFPTRKAHDTEDHVTVSRESRDGAAPLGSTLNRPIEGWNHRHRGRDKRSRRKKLRETSSKHHKMSLSTAAEARMPCMRHIYAMMISGTMCLYVHSEDDRTHRSCLVAASFERKPPLRRDGSCGYEYMKVVCYSPTRT
jgi:hypothetical protein